MFGNVRLMDICGGSDIVNSLGMGSFGRHMTNFESCVYNMESALLNEDCLFKVQLEMIGNPSDWHGDSYYSYLQRLQLN